MTPLDVKKTSRHGKRAENQTVLSVPMDKKLRTELNQLAKTEERTTAQFVRLHLVSIAKRRLKAPTSLVSLDDRDGGSFSSDAGDAQSAS